MNDDNGRGDPPSLEALSDSERALWDELIRSEGAPPLKYHGVGSPLDKVKARAASLAPQGVTRAVADALRGGLMVIQDATDLLVRDGALLAAVRKRGYRANEISDLKEVPIDVLDRISRRSMQAGKIIAALEGAGAGVGGPLFIAADIPALIGTNLRFITQIAHTYGFETSSAQERVFIVHLLGAATADQAAKITFLARLNELAIAAGKNQTWVRLEDRVVVSVVQKIAEQMGVRLTKKKLGQIVPLVGSAVGAGSNYSFTHDNLESARTAYRKRWLLGKCLRADAS